MHSGSFFFFFFFFFFYFAHTNNYNTLHLQFITGNCYRPAEFYKVFWDYVKPFLLNALNCSYTNGHLSITQRRGLITLVPKKNKPANLLKNWRPITLLNCTQDLSSSPTGLYRKSVFRFFFLYIYF